MTSLSWIVAALAAALIGVELLRRDRAQLWMRLAAVLTAAGMLAALMAHRPGRSTHSSPIHLLTPGFLGPPTGRGVFALDAVAGLGDLASRIAPHSAIELDGWGLLAHEWPAERSGQITFVPAPLPIGISELDAPIELAVGEPLVVKGRVTLAPGDSTWIVLEDPAGPRDSAVVSTRSAAFTLSDHPRQAGAANYRLRVISRVDTLGVAIREATPPAVLVLDASPSFETAYLKRWLGSRGARVVIRTAISRGRYRVEEINDSGSTVGALTDATLEGFDVVLVDGGSLVQASDRERSALLRAVRTAGIGLLLTADVPRGLAAGSLFPSLRLVRTAELDGRRTRPVWADAPRQSRVAIEAEPSSLASGSAVTIVRDETGRALAQFLDTGAGRVGVTLLRAPSRWVLEGESDQFASYWSGLIRSVARDTTTRIDLRSDGPRRPDHPITITALAPQPPNRRAQTPRPVLIVRSPTGTVDTLATARDAFDSRRWSGRFWPRVSGWHSVEFAGGRWVPFRVSAEGEWQGVEASARLAVTRARLGRLVAQTKGRSPVDWLQPLAFTLLVFSLAWLWWEGRRRPR